MLFEASFSKIYTGGEGMVQMKLICKRRKGILIGREKYGDTTG
jgi:hypothetical protein